MSKFDSFFSEKAPEELNKKILLNTKAEMERLSKEDRKSEKFRWLSLLLPVGATAAAVLALYLNFGAGVNKMSENEAAGVMAMTVLGSDFVNQILEEEEALEIVDELGVIEDFETLAAMSEMDLEG
ncbi:MAG: hypothetical protein K0R29_256 [Pseudobdellovibrio sp.]|jgi:hypothetical protein|nr:hypothetical protein [Pseudobdellovibrio sp.]